MTMVMYILQLGQNVGLALKIFDQTNSVSLQLFSSDLNKSQHLSTANLINKRRDIMSINYPKKGFHFH